MSKMFDYISGKTEGREAELEATLEHVMAHCVPASALDEQRAEIDRLRAALEEILKLADCDSAGDAMLMMYF